MSESKNKHSLLPSINVVDTTKAGPGANADANQNNGVQGALNIEQSDSIDAGLQPAASSEKEEDKKATDSNNNQGQIETASQKPPIDTPIDKSEVTSDWAGAFRNLGYMLGRLKTYLGRSGSTLGKWMNADFMSLFNGDNVPKNSPKGAATMLDRANAYAINDYPQLKVVTQKFDSIAGEFSDLSQVAGATTKDHGTTASPSVVPPVAAPPFAPHFQAQAQSHNKSNIIPPGNHSNSVVPAKSPAPINPPNSHHMPNQSL